MSTRNFHNIEMPKWLKSSGQFITNVPDNNDDLSDDDKIIDIVYLHVDDEKNVWLSVYPEEDYYGSVKIDKGENIYSIRQKIVDVSNTYYPSSSHDYWSGALGCIADRAIKINEDSDDVCKRCKIYHNTEITDENYKIAMEMLMNIHFPEMTQEEIDDL